MDTRQQKALSIFSCGNIHVIDRAARIFSVPSQRKNQLPYRVDLNAQTCACYDNSVSHHHCKHLQAAELRERELNAVRVASVPTPRTFKNYDQLFAYYAK